MDFNCGVSWIILLFLKQIYLQFHIRYLALYRYRNPVSFVHIQNSIIGKQMVRLIREVVHCWRKQVISTVNQIMHCNLRLKRHLLYFTFTFLHKLPLQWEIKHFKSTENMGNLSTLSIAHIRNHETPQQHWHLWYSASEKLPLVKFIIL